MARIYNIITEMTAVGAEIFNVRGAFRTSVNTYAI